MRKENNGALVPQKVTLAKFCITKGDGGDSKKLPSMTNPGKRVEC